MDYRTTHAITLVVVVFLFALILLSRLIYFPVNFSLVYGYSMYPTLKPGDLLVGIHKEIVGYDVGDVVVWCSSLTYCTVHRVVRFVGTYVVTKGDNNPSEDPPIPESYVKHKVVLVIPSIAWFSASSISVGLYLIKKKEKILWLMRNLKSVELLIFSIFIVINLVLIALVPIHHLAVESVITKPTMNLRSIEILDPGSLILVRYNPQHLNIISVAKCLIEISDQVVECRAYIPASDSVIIIVPSETYVIAFKEGLTSFKTLVNLTLDKGFLVGSYPLHISWSKLGVSVNGSSLVLNNPNYVPINITYAKITYISYDEEARIHKVVQVKELQSFIVGPKNTYVLPVESKGEYAYVMIKYLFMGEEIIEQRRINFS
ncbi:MAG: signal peptidase I [Desulfurococcaceae archaeon TW002]